VVSTNQTPCIRTELIVVQKLSKLSYLEIPVEFHMFSKPMFREFQSTFFSTLKNLEFSKSNLLKLGVSIIATTTASATSRVSTVQHSTRRSRRSRWHWDMRLRVRTIDIETTWLRHIVSKYYWHWDNLATAYSDSSSFRTLSNIKTSTTTLHSASATLTTLILNR